MVSKGFAGNTVTQTTTKKNAEDQSKFELVLVAVFSFQTAN